MTTTQVQISDLENYEFLLALDSLLEHAVLNEKNKKVIADWLEHLKKRNGSITLATFQKKGLSIEKIQKNLKLWGFETKFNFKKEKEGDIYLEVEIL